MHALHLLHSFPAWHDLAPGMRTFIEYGAAACGLYYLLYRVGEWKDDDDGRAEAERRHGRES
jgi:hypothetical protein